MNEEKLLYRKCLDNGVDLSYRDISLSDLANYTCNQIRPRYVYQVHSEHYTFSHLYRDIEDALDKFIELKHNRKTNRKYTK